MAAGIEAAGMEWLFVSRTAEGGGYSAGMAFTTPSNIREVRNSCL